MAMMFKETLLVVLVICTVMPICFARPRELPGIWYARIHLL